VLWPPIMRCRRAICRFLDVSNLVQAMKASSSKMPCCFSQMVMETKSSLESGIIGSGHSFAAARLDAQRGAGGWVQEQMSGLAYLEHIRSLAARVDSDWPGVQADLEAIRRARLCVSCIAVGRVPSACLCSCSSESAEPGTFNAKSDVAQESIFICARGRTAHEFSSV